MHPQMLARRGKELLRSARPSFAGTGLLERMRSTAFALLGITAAMALGLVALAAHQDWPLLPAAPIPGVPQPAELGEARIVAMGPELGAAREAVAEPASEGRVGGGHGAAALPPRSSRVSGSRELTAAPPQASPEQAPASDSPAAPEVPAPSPAPASSTVSAPTATAPPSPAPAPSAPASASSPDTGPVVASGVKEGSDEAAAGGGEANGRGKSSGKSKPKWSKPVKGDASDADLAPPPPAAPAPPPTSSPSVPDDAAVEEEAADDAAAQAPASPGRSRGHGSWRSWR